MSVPGLKWPESLVHSQDQKLAEFWPSSQKPLFSLGSYLWTPDNVHPSLTMSPHSITKTQQLHPQLKIPRLVSPPEWVVTECDDLEGPGTETRLGKEECSPLLCIRTQLARRSAPLCCASALSILSPSTHHPVTLAKYEKLLIAMCKMTKEVI